MRDILEISHYVPETKVLGPYLRSALWVHGCCFHCDGCLAYEMNSREPDKRTVRELADIFAANKITEGITISGGEPFFQAEALSVMIDTIRQKRDYGVIVYSGFTIEEITESGNEAKLALLKRADILIDGRYRKELDDGIPYRGSSNQRIHMLTSRYRDDYNSYYEQGKRRDIEIDVRPDHIYMVGVPSKKGLGLWNDLKRKAEAHG